MKRILGVLVTILLAVMVVMPAEITILGHKLYRPLIDFTVFGKRWYRDLNIKLGLDLQGGTHLTYLADMTNVAEADKKTAVEAARNNIEKRVNLLGVSESVIETSKVGSDYRLIVELPGVKDVTQAIGLIGQTAQLDFRETKVATPSSEKDFIPTGLTGRDLKLAQVQFQSSSQGLSQPVVSLQFSPEGTKKFADITGRNIGRQVAIFLDEQVVTAPVVQTTIADGQAVISGNFSVDTAKALTIQLNAGALPIPIKLIEQRNIGATLGQDSIHKSMLAGVIGLITVALFMIANYGVKGLLADIALTVYVLVFMAIIKLIPITLTLAGIAGFILSIGMAVDANILIFERMKEELRKKRPLAVALELGFNKAWNSIRDSNASSLITASVLFWFGTGAVRGFALTLAVGVCVSLFSAIFVTKTLLKLVYTKDL